MDFNRITLAELRERQSAKWRTYGPDVLPAWIAETDVELAPPIKTALQEAIARGDTGYSHLSFLEGAVAGWLTATYGRPVTADDVIGAPDVMVGIAETLRIVSEPGGGVVINPPVYPPFFHVIPTVGRRVVEVPLQNGELDLDGLRGAFAAGARTYLLCSPHNPTGAVWTGETLAEVAGLAAEFDVTVLADEVHGPLALPGAQFVPYATVARDAISFTSASKAWNLAGLKCAAIVTSERYRGIRDRLPSELHWQVSNLGAIAMIAALRDGQEWLNEFLLHLDRNRALLGELLADKLPEIGYHPPAASYLAWLDCRALNIGPDPAATFLDRGDMALSCGPDFGAQGAGFARLNIGTTEGLLTEAVERMARSIR
jgi:cystathionine beta-lyase